VYGRNPTPYISSVNNDDQSRDGPSAGRTDGSSPHHPPSRPCSDVRTGTVVFSNHGSGRDDRSPVPSGSRGLQRRRAHFVDHVHHVCHGRNGPTRRPRRSRCRGRRGRRTRRRSPSRRRKTRPTTTAATTASSPAATSHANAARRSGTQGDLRGRDVGGREREAGVGHRDRVDQVRERQRHQGPPCVSEHVVLTDRG